MDAHLLRFSKTKVFTFVDLETYGLCLNFINNKPWQVGILKVVGDNTVDSHDIIVNWPTPPKFEKETVLRIFKVTVEQLLNRIKTTGIAPEKAFEILYKNLNECDHIVGHNILGFDAYLIKEWCLLMGKPWKHFIDKMIDTHCLLKGIKLQIPYRPPDSLLAYQYRMCNKIVKGLKTRLEVAGKEFEIEHEYEKLHDAIVDLDLNRKIWNKIKHQVEI